VHLVVGYVIPYPGVHAAGLSLVISFPNTIYLS